MGEELVNKHVFITGAARGIGYGIAEQFAKAGSRITILDNNPENLEKASHELSKITGAEVLAIQADVSDRSAVQKAVSQAEAKAPIDVLVNDAGVAYESSFLDISDEEWDKVLSINLKGMFIVSQEVLKNMVKRKAGIVINMGSKNGLDGEWGYAHYNASKGGVIMLTKTLALEFAHVGIRTNAVCPGYIETPMSKEIDSPEFVNSFVDRYIPMNRPGNVEEIAKIFLFLASDGSAFMNGQIIIADGGQLAGQKPFPDKIIR